MKKSKLYNYVKRLLCLAMSSCLLCSVSPSALANAVAGNDRESSYIDDSNFRIQYTGGWVSEWNEDAYQGTQQYCAAGTASLTFTGSGIQVLCTKQHNTGDLKILVDGQEEAVVNTLSISGKESQSVVFQKNFEQTGEHTITLEVIGTPSDKPYVVLDAFKVIGVPDEEQDPIKIACIGDSLTAGYLASSSSKSYPAQLQLLLGNQYEVRNFGVSSKTLLNNGDQPYTETVAYQQSKIYNPDIVIIMLGTNDSRPMNWQYKDLFAEDAFALIESYRSLPSKPIVYFATSPYCYAVDYNGAREEVIANEVVPLQRQIAKEAGCKLIDIFEKTIDHEYLYNPDLCHFTDDGYAYLAQCMYDGLLQGYREDLTLLVEQSKALDLNMYQDGTEKEAFLSALSAAEAILQDENATVADVEAAQNNLSASREELKKIISTGDKTELKKVIDEADVKNSELDRYVDDADAKQKFADALAEAKEVYEKDGATQDEIDQAKNNLLDAMTGLRLRADKDNLNKWLEDLKSIDLSQYTEESAAVVRAVIAKAEALAAQDLDENDQDLINAMVAEMAIAKVQLVLAPTDPEDPEDPNPGDGSGESSNPESSKPNGDASSQNEANSEGKEATDDLPTTGDSVPVAAFSLMVVATAGAWLAKKKRK